jgi:hypothetical protein
MDEKVVGRNEPCPCGSGKKFKRCCGVAAAPILGAPKAPTMDQLKAAAAEKGLPFDPSQMDPEMMNKLGRAMSRLPKGQLQRLQAIMQKAMTGKDVSREAAELEGQLPVEFQEMVRSMSGMPGMAEMPQSDMSEADARRIVEEAVKKGELSADQAKQVLAGQAPAIANDQADSSKLSKLWKSIRGEKKS